MTILVSLGIVLVIAVPTLLAGGPSYPLCGWDDGVWYNNSHGNSVMDHEPMPDIAKLNQVCPPNTGTLLVRCSSDRDTSFSEWLYGRHDNFDVECTPLNGSVCESYGRRGRCEDYAIQLGCDCSTPQVPTTSSPATPTTTSSPATPTNCSQTSGTTPSSENQTLATQGNCNCPSGSDARRSSTPQCHVKLVHQVFIFCFVLFVLNI